MTVPSAESAAYDTHLPRRKPDRDGGAYTGRSTLADDMRRATGVHITRHAGKGGCTDDSCERESRTMLRCELSALMMQLLGLEL